MLERKMSQGELMADVASVKVETLLDAAPTVLLPLDEDKKSPTDASSDSCGIPMKPKKTSAPARPPICSKNPLRSVVMLPMVTLPLPKPRSSSGVTWKLKCEVDASAMGTPPCRRNPVCDGPSVVVFMLGPSFLVELL